MTNVNTDNSVILAELNELEGNSVKCEDCSSLVQTGTLPHVNEITCGVAKGRSDPPLTKELIFF